MKDLRHQIPNLFFRIAEFLEIVVAAIVTVAICITILSLAGELLDLYQEADTVNVFHELLVRAFTVIIGVEFLKMLCRHNMSSVIEVVLFAIARRMVVEHATPLETLMLVAALAGAFLIRKYLFIPGLDDKDHSVRLGFGRNEEKQEKEMQDVC